MSGAQHTAGPWSYKHGDICGPDDMDGDDLVLAALGTSYGLRSAPYSTVCKGPEMEANARLIAAAPDLLAALKEMSAIVAIHSKATGRNFAWAELECAEAAIAKAEGRS